MATDLLHDIRRTSPVKLVRQEMLHRILELRRKGLTHAEIAKELNIAPNTAHYHIKKYLRELVEVNKYDLEELRSLENERHDELLKEAHRRFEQGDVTFVEFAAISLKISERRAKLNGLDVNVNNTNLRIGSDLSAMSDEELKSRLQEALSMKAESAPPVDNDGQ